MTKALEVGMVVAILMAVGAFAVWGNGIKMERDHECRMTHGQDYCMWHGK